MTSASPVAGFASLCLLAGLALSSQGCSSHTRPYRMEMMPPPAIYAAGVVSSPDDRHPELRDGRVSVPYATHREPAPPDQDERYYGNGRGPVLRLGHAVVSATPDQLAGRERRAAPMMLEVTAAEEFGVLPETHVPFAPVDFAPALAGTGPGDFAAAVDRMLLDGPGRDVYVYVHGYKVVFENAITVSTELWHYLDYEGAFIAFAWPATPRRLAYLGDLETAEMAGIVLRRFLTYLARETHARRIHIVGYSAGTRVVTSALAGLALARHERAPSAAGDHRIGQVVLIGSDMDRGLMALQVSEGILDLVDNFTVYVSSRDKAMNVARRLHGRERAGEAFTSAPTPAARAWLDASPRLAVIDVTDAAGSTTENGHRYFRTSPWVSSDMLTMLRFGLGPAQRGLVRAEHLSMWRFPPDYLERLSVSLRTMGVGNAGGDPGMDWTPNVP